MPRHDDEFDDDHPRRRPRDDDEDDRPRRRSIDDDDDLPPRRTKKKSSLGLILAIVGGVLFLMFALCLGGIWWLYSKVPEAADRLHSSNNLKQIQIGCFNYENVNQGFPTDSYSPDGKPLLSWRVHILPYIEQNALYLQFKLDEPWDSANNIRLLSQMPNVYATPAESRGKVGKGTKTYYRGFTSPGAMFAPPKIDGQGKANLPGFNPQLFVRAPHNVRLLDITDGTSNTFLVVEAGEATDWTKPGDLDASPGKPFPPMGGVRPNADVFAAVFADGSIHMIKKNRPEAELRALVTYNGGEIVSPD